MLANGSIAMTMYFSSFFPSPVSKFGIEGAVWALYFPRPCPERFLMGAKPFFVIASWIAFPISQNVLFSLTAFIAASRASCDAFIRSSCFPVRSTVIAVSPPTQPSICAPTSNFTTSSPKTALSSG